MAFDLDVPTSKSLASQLIVVLTTPPAAATGIPTRTEVNAAIGAHQYIYGRFDMTPSQNTGEGPRKNARRSAPTELGMVTYPAAEMQYSYLPQELGTPGNVGNKLYEAMSPGANLTLVIVDGVEGDKLTEMPASTVGDVYRIETGVRRKGATGDGEFDHSSVTQSVVVKGDGPLAEDHVFTT